MNLPMHIKVKIYIISDFLFPPPCIYHKKMTHALLVMYTNVYFTRFIVVEYQKCLKREINNKNMNTLKQFRKNYTDLYG